MFIFLLMWEFLHFCFPTLLHIIHKTWILTTSHNFCPFSNLRGNSFDAHCIKISFIQRFKNIYPVRNIPDCKNTLGGDQWTEEIENSWIGLSIFEFPSLLPFCFDLLIHLVFGEKKKEKRTGMISDKTNIQIKKSERKTKNKLFANCQ